MCTPKNMYLYIICIKEYLNKIDREGKYSVAPLWRYVLPAHRCLPSLKSPDRVGPSHECHRITWGDAWEGQETSMWWALHRLLLRLNQKPQPPSPESALALGSWAWHQLGESTMPLGGAGETVWTSGLKSDRHELYCCLAHLSALYPWVICFGVLEFHSTCFGVLPSPFSNGTIRLTR